MPDNVYKIVELVGSSEASISKAIDGATRRPARPSVSSAGSR
jgi:flavin-binding protein dodecin